MPVRNDVLEPLSDEELCALALSSDPEAEVADDAVPLAEIVDVQAPSPLPIWYMPAPMGGSPPLRGWRRGVVVLVIAAFLTITAFGLCNTYGQLHG